MSRLDFEYYHNSGAIYTVTGWIEGVNFSDLIIENCWGEIASEHIYACVIEYLEVKYGIN